MKYGLEMKILREECEARGEARGKMLQLLELAVKMLEKNDDFDYISDFLGLPIECVVALNDGVSIETIME